MSSGSCHLGQPEALERAVGGPDVAVAEAVGDHRAAADDRLEDGQSAAGVHQRVAGRQHVAHPIGEAHEPQARLVAERAWRPRRGACRCARTGTARSRPGPRAPRAVAPSRSPTPQPPPETAITLALGRQAERRAGHRRASGRPGRPATSGAWPSDAVRAGDPLDLLDRLGMGDEVQVDAGMGPEVQARPGR